MQLFTVAFFNSLLLAPLVFAAPFGGSILVARRSEGLSQPNNRLEQPDDSAVSNTEYSTNWAGAVWSKAANTFNSVTGTFNVPAPTGQNGDSGAVWVGIDGDTCQSAILQTGIAFTVGNNNQVTYGAWYEWYPAPATFFPNAIISAGDVIRLTVTASSATSGTTKIENLTTGQILSQEVTSTTPLCGQDAEWIVEDYQEGGNLVPFANFGTVTFTNAEVTGPSTSLTVSGATPIELVENNQVVTTVTENGSSLTITDTE